MASSGVPVEVEVLLLRLSAPPGRPAALAYRALRRPLRDGESPDEVALQLSGLSLAASPGAVCHSTSWRYRSRVVLTYAALPDPEPGLSAVPLPAPTVLSSGDPLRPTPADLHGYHVVAHAVRHLALLVGEDPAIAAAAAAGERALWTAIGIAAAAMPTGTHDDLLAGDHAHRQSMVGAAVE